VKAAGDASAAGEEARRDEMTKIESACAGSDETRRCKVVSFFAGDKYTLHTYRKYTDVRMVLGPEGAAAQFGGDPDNFSFPRYAFDVAYLRLYENGKPAVTPNHFKWRSEPLKDGEPVFISGHPGASGRTMPTAFVDYLADTYFPFALVMDSEMRGRLIAYAAQGTEQTRITQAQLYDTENAYKENWGEHLALMRGILRGVHERDAKLRAAIDADPALKAEVGDAWEKLDKAAEIARQVFYLRQFLGQNSLMASDLFQYGRTILRVSQERLKPEDQRLPGYADTDIAGLLDQVAAETPVLKAKEEILLSFWLAKVREHLTADHPVVRKVLGKESPEGLAARLVAETTLADPAERKRLFEAGMAAVDASKDPMFVLLKAIDAEGREVDRRYRDEVLAVFDESKRRIDPIRIRLASGVNYPDANTTLRLSYGRVEGWVEPDGRKIEPFTTFAGLLDRATGAYPFKLADRWEAAKGTLNPETLFNASINNDSMGGNSGSPILDEKGQVVGAMFDGNLHSFGGYYLFEPERNRSVMINATAIEEALAKVYGLKRIVDELKQ
jgi:hypothetical protein